MRKRPVNMTSIDDAVYLPQGTFAQVRRANSGEQRKTAGGGLAISSGWSLLRPPQPDVSADKKPKKGQTDQKPIRHGYPQGMPPANRRVETMEVSKCPKCGSQLDRPGASGGRPRRWCSSGCQRSGEAQMRRLTLDLKHLERSRTWYQLDGRDTARIDAVIAQRQAEFDRLAGVPERSDA